MQEPVQLKEDIKEEDNNKEVKEEEEALHLLHHLLDLPLLEDLHLHHLHHLPVLHSLLHQRSVVVAVAVAVEAVIIPIERTKNSFLVLLTLADLAWSAWEVLSPMD